jgi:hypothetical protein
MGRKQCRATNMLANRVSHLHTKHSLTKNSMHTCVDVAVVPMRMLEDVEKRLGSGLVTDC